MTSWKNIAIYVIVKELVPRIYTELLQINKISNLREMGKERK